MFKEFKNWNLVSLTHVADRSETSLLDLAASPGPVGCVTKSKCTWSANVYIACKICHMCKQSPMTWHKLCNILRVLRREHCIATRSGKVLLISYLVLFLTTLSGRYLEGDLLYLWIALVGSGEIHC